MKQPKLYYTQDYDDTPVFYSSIEEIKEKHPAPTTFAAVYEDNTSEYFSYQDLTDRGLVRQVTRSEQEIQTWAEKEVRGRESFFQSLGPGTVTGWCGFLSVPEAVAYAKKQVTYEWVTNSRLISKHTALYSG